MNSVPNTSSPSTPADVGALHAAALGGAATPSAASPGAVAETLWFDNEHPSLAACWHPVADLAALDGPGPHPVRLLGRDWALFAATDAGAAAPRTWALLPDICPHRLAPLTAGTLEVGPDGPVVRCAYHGWCFDPAGRCVEIPAVGPDARIPPSAHLRPAAATREAYGLVWASIDEPITPFPEYPEYGDPAYGEARIPVHDWNASAAQMADNFLDVAHFPFTHTGTIGDPDDQVVGDYELSRDGWTFAAHHRHSSQLLDGSGHISERTMDFVCTAPHHVRLCLDYGHQQVALAFFHQPIDVDTTRIYCIQLDTAIAADPAMLQPTIDFQVRVGTEDRLLLERLVRKAVPLGAGHESHTRADRITVELRRVLTDLVAATATVTTSPTSTPTPTTPTSPPPEPTTTTDLAP